jgi:FlaA1/EpsC-like NDP-sugar epimerase
MKKTLPKQQSVRSLHIAMGENVRLLIDFLFKIVKSKYISRWTVLSVDLFLSTLSFFICYLSAVDVYDSSIHFHNFLIFLAINLVISVLVFLAFKTYVGVIRYSSFSEIGRIIFVVIVLNALMYVATKIVDPFGALFSVNYWVNVTLLSILLITFRYVVVHLYSLLSEYCDTVRGKRSLIFGIEAESVSLARSLELEGFQYHVVGFLTRNKTFDQQRILDMPVYHLNGNFEYLTKEKRINSIVFPTRMQLLEEESQLVRSCADNNVKVMLYQQPQMWEKNLLLRNKINDVQIEDLLERDEIKIDLEEIRNKIQGKVVMVTGAAGSIGSELVRQLVLFNPAKVVLFDIAETALANLELEMADRCPGVCEAMIGDVRNKHKVEFAFQTFKPSIVYHAAAYKHVPVMEKDPCEAILTNVLGTKIVANLAIKYSADKFVMISTDKAVNPSSIMGASKRIAEIYVQTLAKHFEKRDKNVHFITTRFGNVLGSNGSVIPRFKEQIQKGGPVTVTHPDIIRYFMTIPEACRLVLEASANGRNAEIYMFDMGKPVKIADLAKKMISMVGYVPDKDIKIIYTGLRNGEKLYEDLLNDKETTEPTFHEKILAAKVREYRIRDVIKLQNQLLSCARALDVDKTVKKMKEFVPEFKSLNSIYESVDKISVRADAPVFEV